MQSTTSVEYKTYRRIIFCKITKVNFKQFLHILQQDKWTKANYFEKRGAQYSYIKNLPDGMRYHMRLYEIEDYLYMLIHLEPGILMDPFFHVRGFWTQFRNRKRKILNTEKLELADYEKGRAYFDELVKNYEILREICEFDIDDDDLKIFASKFGLISLKLPLELLVEDLKDAINTDNKLEFNSALSKILEVMEFNQIEVNPDFLVFESLLINNFTILIQKLKVAEINLYKLAKNVIKFNVTSTILVLSEQDTLPDGLMPLLINDKISVISPYDFFKIFTSYENTSMTHEEFQQIFNKKGLIDSDFLDKILQQNDFSTMLQKTILLFKFLKNQKTWVTFKDIEKEFIKSKMMHEKELKKILSFLTFPLIKLILTKSKKLDTKEEDKLYLAVKNVDEAQLRLKNLKKFLSEIALIPE